MGRTLERIKDKPTRRQTEKCRAAIQTSLLVRSLSDIALGKREGSAVQVRAAATLLAKVLPDMQAMSIVQEEGPPEMSVPELQARMLEMGLEAVRAMSPAERRELLSDEIEGEAKVIALQRNEVGNFSADA